MTTPIANVYIAPLAADKFVAAGFPLPEVDLTPVGFHAYTIKQTERGRAWAEMLSQRSAEDAVARLATEIERNRTTRAN